MQDLKIFFFIIFFFPSVALSNHIVGGEIVMKSVGSPGEFRYEVSLIQYFDCAQTENPGPDTFVTYTIFRKI